MAPADILNSTPDADRARLRSISPLIFTPKGTVGVDREAGVIAEAQHLLDSRPISGVEFRAADVYELPFDDESFDVVHAHQLLQHLTDPVAALVEMRRVLRPGGVLAVRDSDYGGFVWAPADPLLDRWMEPPP